MFKSQRKFIITLLFIALIITVLGYGLFLFLIPQYYFPHFPVIPAFLLLVTAFLLLVTIMVHVYLIKSSENNPRKFTSKYLGAMGLKMFIYMIFLVVFLFIDRAHAVPFLVSFLVTYAVFTLYEVISILNYLKKDK
jgi:phosphatidylglycerophosphate synthase